MTKPSPASVNPEEMTWSMTDFTKGPDARREHPVSMYAINPDPEPEQQLMLFELGPEEQWVALSSRKFPLAESIAEHLPLATHSGAGRRFTEIPVRFSGEGIIKGFALERIGTEPGTAARHALVWRVEATDLSVEGIG